MFINLYCMRAIAFSMHISQLFLLFIIFSSAKRVNIIYPNQIHRFKHISYLHSELFKVIQYVYLNIRI